MGQFLRLTGYSWFFVAMRGIGRAKKLMDAGDEFMGQSWKVNFLSTKWIFFIFVFACVAEYFLIKSLSIKDRHELQIFFDICSLAGFLLTIVLAKTAKSLMLKIKILSKANQWASKRELVLQELQGYRENIVNQNAYDDSIRCGLLSVIENIKTYEDAFNNDTKEAINKLLKILNNDLRCFERVQVSTLVSSILGKIKEDQNIDRILDILDD